MKEDRTESSQRGLLSYCVLFILQDYARTRVSVKNIRLTQGVHQRR